MFTAHGNTFLKVLSAAYDVICIKIPNKVRKNELVSDFWFSPNWLLCCGMYTNDRCHRLD